ncbi:tetraspanin-32 [Ascaphus truei]|uniref:tetraspanin-32 n=1 Tax=Ascaphus truei TaxID=8439 RepID=UPI003F5A883C
MGQKLWVRVTRCQLLASCLFIMLLAASVCIVTVMTGWGSYFTVLTSASPAESPARGLHRAMVLYGGSVCAALLLVSLLSSLSVLRESQHLMAIGFLGFAFLFCALMAGVTWTHESKNQVEVSFLDVYDGLYEEVLRKSPGVQKERLLSVHEALFCCGKIRGTLRASETHSMCQSTDRQDCVSVISAVLHTLWLWVSALLLLSLGLMLYGMILSSFLYFSLPRGTNWDRRGKYSLTDASKCPSSDLPHTPLTQLLPYQSAECRFV